MIRARSKQIESGQPPITEPAPAATLWSNADFQRLWIGQSTSLIGTQVTLLALPLTAILIFHASAVQVGLLTAAQFLPYVLFSLPAGVWVDRVARRPMLLITNLFLSAIVAAVPVLALGHLLHLQMLYAVAFGIGSFAMLFEIAYSSYLPTVVDRKLLVGANSRLEFSRSMAQMSGASVGGFLVAALTAPVAMLVDAVSYLLAAACIATIKTPEPVRVISLKHPIRDLVDGVRFVATHSTLRSLGGAAALLNFGLTIQGAVFVLYMVTSLHLPTTVVGVVLAAGSLGGLLGSILGAMLSGRLGNSLVLTGSGLTLAAAIAIVPLAGHMSGFLVIAVLLTSGVVYGLSRGVISVNLVSIRQRITPDSVMGRVNACMRFVGTSMIPAGAAAGGIIGERVGLGEAFLVSAGVLCAAVALLLTSPLSHQLPD